MKTAKDFIGLLQSAFFPAIAFGVIAFFGGYAIFGVNGALAWGEYSQAYPVREAQLAALEKRRAVLANRVALLDPNNADRDLADELVRRELDYVQPDEVIILAD